MSTSRAAKFVGAASEVAHYYGFRPLPEIAPETASPSARPLPLAAAAGAVAAKWNSAEEPLLSFYAASGSGGRESAVAPRDSGEFSLQIVGCPTSIGEIHVLKTLEAIVGENGGAVSCARINSLGDRDSRARFARELGIYLRRHASSYESELDAREASLISEHPLRAYRTRSDALRTLLRDAPHPVHYLSEKSRTHFRQVLEHLERVSFPYVIDDMLVGPAPGGDECDSRVLFELDIQDETGALQASLGGRYDDLIARPGGRLTPLVYAAITFHAKTLPRSLPLKPPAAPPKVYFIQFGDSAKLTGFSVIDTLRRARVPVGVQFDARHLAPQLSAAQGLGVPYVLIMGAREAIDQTVIVRTLATSAQTIVPIDELPKHLRALKLV